MRDTTNLIEVIHELGNSPVESPLEAEHLCDVAGDKVQSRIESLLSYSSREKIHYIMGRRGECAEWEECNIVPDTGIGYFRGFTTVSSALDAEYQETMTDTPCLVIQEPLDTDSFTLVPIGSLSGVTFFDEALQTSDEINPLTEVMSYEYPNLFELVGTVALIDSDISDKELNYLSQYVSTMRKPTEYARAINTTGTDVAWITEPTDRFMLTRLADKISLFVSRADRWGCTANGSRALAMTDTIKPDDLFKKTISPESHRLLRVL